LERELASQFADDVTAAVAIENGFETVSNTLKWYVWVDAYEKASKWWLLAHA
jgi:hypothetical protein